MVARRTFTTSRDMDKFVVRLPDGLRDVITVVARQQNTSMNTVIVDKLIELSNNGRHLNKPYQIGNETYINLFDDNLGEVVLSVGVNSDHKVSLHLVGDSTNWPKPYRVMTLIEYAKLVL